MLRYCALPALLLWSLASAWASESYHPPEGDEAWQMARLYLKPVGQSNKASGTAVFACNMAVTQHRCQMYAKGLRANAMYSLWLVEMDGYKVKRTHRVSSRWRKLFADKRGVVYFAGNLPWCPVGKDAFVVKYHADQGKRKFADGVTVLKGYLAKLE